MGIETRKAKSGTRYRARVQHDGERIKGPWQDAKWKAQDDESAMRKSIARGTWHEDYGAERVPTFREVAAEYLQEFTKLVSEGKRAQRTLDMKRQHLEARIYDAFGDTRIDRIRLLDVERFKREVYQATSGPTANRYLSTLSRVFSFGRAHIVANPCREVPRYEENTDAWAAVDEDLAELLIGYAYEDTNANMGPFLVLIWEAMLRSKSEALVIRVEHIDWKWRHGIARGLIRLPKTKGGDDQAVPMSPRLHQALRDHAQGHGSEWLFPNRFDTGHLDQGTIYRGWKRIKAAARADGYVIDPGLRLHDFRHGGATDLIAKGASRAKVQAMLRHKTRVMTDRYVHLTEEHAADALKARTKVTRFRGRKKAAGTESGPKSGPNGSRGHDDSR